MQLVFHGQCFNLNINVSGGALVRAGGETKM